MVNPAQNKVITNTYDDATGNLLTTTDTGLLGDGTPYTYTTTYAYYANGKLTSIDGPRTDVRILRATPMTPATGTLDLMTQPLIGTTTYSQPRRPRQSPDRHRPERQQHDLYL